ncbi:hypothetical protein Cflav_PD6213 [Pedosphaera parvula Ellin514]|uniref:Uncharacterized protein n=1 Tax=Pedosphaera parvula (strain Ellin514) TaxID=320771 RepID=B9XHP4_PEDPL|nr:hypothetical protein Cflav_PD6213 [Pedosphaera parvula Ellin514]
MVAACASRSGAKDFYKALGFTPSHTGMKLYLKWLPKISTPETAYPQTPMIYRSFPDSI